MSHMGHRPSGNSDRRSASLHRHPGPFRDERLTYSRKMLSSPIDKVVSSPLCLRSWGSRPSVAERIKSVVGSDLGGTFDNDVGIEAAAWPDS